MTGDFFLPKTVEKLVFGSQEHVQYVFVIDYCTRERVNILGNQFFIKGRVYGGLKEPHYNGSHLLKILVVLLNTGMLSKEI